MKEIITQGGNVLINPALIAGILKVDNQAQDVHIHMQNGNIFYTSAQLDNDLQVFSHLTDDTFVEFSLVGTEIFNNTLYGKFVMQKSSIASIFEHEINHKKFCTITMAHEVSATKTININLSKEHLLAML